VFSATQLPPAGQSQVALAQLRVGQIWTTLPQLRGRREARTDAPGLKNGFLAAGRRR
jgi:hypothetical protein